MSRILVGIAFAVCAATTASSADVPPCRLDNTLAAPAAQAARDAMRGYAAAGRSLPLNEVSVAPDSRPGALVIELVRDAEPDMIDDAGCPTGPKGTLTRWIADPDAISVDGVCVVFAQDRIRCSANALARLTAQELENRGASTTMLFVLAHELGHIVRGDVAKFVDAGTTLDRAAPLAVKFHALDASCPLSPQTEIAIEQGADTEAREAMVRVLADSPYRESVLSPRASLLSQASRLRVAAANFESWPEASDNSSGVVRDIMQHLPLPASTKDIEKAAHRAACAILVHRKGQLRLPVLRGSHPDTPRRLTAIADSLEASARTLSATAPSGADQPLPPSADTLVADVSNILNQVDREYAEMYPTFVSALCTLRNQWRNQSFTQTQIESECTK